MKKREYLNPLVEANDHRLPCRKSERRVSNVAEETIPFTGELLKDVELAHNILRSNEKLTQKK